MAVGYTTSTASTNVDPAVQPYLTYGLEEAQRLYQANTPVVGPSASTTQALEAMRQRALTGNPLVGAAQGQLASTIGGQYLSGNPFFQGAFAPAAEAAQTAFNKGVGDISSAASKAGRYGVNAATQNLFGGNANTFAKALTGTAGQLAYQNYADERAKQLAATSAAPAFAAQDYADINALMKVGQTGEAYTSAANAQPMTNLTNYLSAVYGTPMGRTSTQTNPYYTNPTANALGTGLLGLQVANAAAPLVKQGYNWLSSQFGDGAISGTSNFTDVGGLGAASSDWLASQSWM